MSVFHTGHSPYDIWLRFKKIISRLHSEKAVAFDWRFDLKDKNVTNSYLLRRLKRLLLRALSTPISSFPVLAKSFKVFEEILKNQNIDDWTQEHVESRLADSAQFHEPSFAAIACSDSNGTLYNKTLDDLRPAIVAIKKQNYTLSQSVVESMIICTQWQGKHIYTGPFGGKTKNPILFVSNTRDFVTPLENGRAAVQRFQNALQLTINGTGHVSSALENYCAEKWIGLFFAKGKMSGKINSCPEEPGAFGVKIEPFESSYDWQLMKKEIAELREESVQGNRWNMVY
ncbi:hypothetical protein EG329_010434 [Mollisiaceae sp. DMI_Dod_QoI]|nr:hypothetical protein EG329_010434 [Helotiales sp. DMI_Dod_QoI]